MRLYEQALTQYDVKPCPGESILFLTDRHPAGFTDHLGGWAEVAQGGVRLFPIPTNPRRHGLAGPAAEQLAALLRGCLDLAIERSRSLSTNLILNLVATRYFRLHALPSLVESRTLVASCCSRHMQVDFLCVLPQRRVPMIAELSLKPEWGSRLMKDCRQFFVDGKWVNPTKPHDFPVINPAIEQTIATISVGTAHDVDDAVAAATNAFPSFSETTVPERLALLEKTIEIYRSKMDEMAETISMEMGAPPWFAKAAQAPVGLAHLTEIVMVLASFKFEELKAQP